MMNFIRDNIVKIAIILVVVIILIVVISACGKMGPTSVSSDEGYSDMENRLQTAAIKYVESNKRLLPKTTDQVRKIQLSTLLSNNMINELHAVENNNVTCRGYVEITKKDSKEEDYRYTPFIKCGKYYETKTISQYILDNEKIATTGEGLYQELVSNPTPTEKTDSKTTEEEVATDASSYYYKGEYPNNYIILGERLYRIMGITEDNNLKVISTAKTYRSYNWDDRFNTEDDNYSGINDFDKSRLKENLEFIYTNTDEEEGEIFFSEEEKGYIIDHDFCVGKRSEKDVNINSTAECEVKSKNKVGIITVSDYYKVSTSSSCDAVGKQECNNYNYLYSIEEEDDSSFMTLTADKDDSFSFYFIDEGDYDIDECNSYKQLYPVVFLDNRLLYKSGTGTKEDPFIVR